MHSYEEYHRNGCDGEIDVYGIKDRYVVLFEVKSTDCQAHYMKSREQLNRAKINCFKGYRVFKFYAYGKDDSFQYRWIR